MDDIYCMISHVSAYKGLTSSNCVMIRFYQAEEFKYELTLDQKNQYG